MFIKCETNTMFIININRENDNGIVNKIESVNGK